MSPLSTLLVLCGIAAYKLQVSNTIILPPIDLSEFMCMEERFPENHVCKTLFPHHKSIMVPNPSQILKNGFLGRDSLEDHFNASLLEFGKVAGVLTGMDQCSDKIATLLCFFYFPSCNIAKVGSRNVTFTTFPCRSLCEEVTALDSECTKIIPNNNTWGPYFQGCNLTYGEDENGQTRHVYSEERCINATHPSYYQVKNCKKINSTLDLTSSCKSNCKYRGNANPKTFKKNNYNFAIKCTVNSVLTQGPFGKGVINCTINEQFPVKDERSCTEAPMLENGISILILGYSSSCSNNCFSSLETGNQYIIAGTYVIRENCKDTLWFVKHKDLIAPISTKLEKHFKSYVEKGNRERCPSS